MASREIEYGDEDESTQCCSKNIPELKKSALTTKKAEKIASRSLSCDWIFAVTARLFLKFLMLEMKLWYRYINIPRMKMNDFIKDK